MPDVFAVARSLFQNLYADFIQFNFTERARDKVSVVRASVNEEMEMLLDVAREVK